MLDPGAGKTHRAYLWTYCSTALQGTKLDVFNFAESRASRHPAEFLGHPGEGAWRGTLVCDDYSGYKALFTSGVIATRLAHRTAPEGAAGLGDREGDRLQLGTLEGADWLH